MEILLDFSWITTFITSNAFIGFSIILIALYIVNFYKGRYKEDQKRAAKILLGEIRFAEKGIEEIAHRLTNYLYGEYPSVLPSNSWEDLRGMFVDELDQDEVDMMSDFYSNCMAIEDFVLRERDVFWGNADSRAAMIQEKLADAVMRSYHHGRVDRRVLADYKKLVLDFIAHDEYNYIPKQAMRLLDSYVVRARRISDTSVILKLKDIANE